MQQLSRAGRLHTLVFIAVEQGPELPHELDERRDTPEGFTRDPGFPGMCQRVTERHALGSSPRVQPSHARVAYPPTRDVEDPLQGHLVAWVRNRVQVGEHVFYFSAVIKP